MGRLISYSDLHFAIIWIQPIFWMLFFHYKTKKLDKLFVPSGISIFILMVAAKLFPPLTAVIFSISESAILLALYITLGYIFTWYLMYIKKWHLPQSLSISALATFIGSFYWEAAYIVRNAILIGFEWDWFLHILVFFYVWYIKDSVGWCPDKKKFIALICTGHIVSILFMVFNPVAPGMVAPEMWNSPYYLLNRVICTTIIFILINKDKIEDMIEEKI